MVINLTIFLRVAGRYQYKTVARKREAPPHRRPQWLQPQVVDGIVIPVYLVSLSCTSVSCATCPRSQRLMRS